MSTSTEFPFNIWLKKLTDSKDNIATKVAEAGRDFFLSEFDKAEWEGEPWHEVERNIPGTNANKYSKYAGLPILVNTGALRQAVADCIKNKAWNGIVWTVDCDYAQYHNEGIGQVKRQFIGDSYEFRKIVTKVVEDSIVKIIK